MENSDNNIVVIDDDDWTFVNEASIDDKKSIARSIDSEPPHVEIEDSQYFEACEENNQLDDLRHIQIYIRQGQSRKFVNVDLTSTTVASLKKQEFTEAFDNGFNIRFIHMGALMQDHFLLKEYNLKPNDLIDCIISEKAQASSVNSMPRVISENAIDEYDQYIDEEYNDEDNDDEENEVDFENAYRYLVMITGITLLFFWVLFANYAQYFTPISLIILGSFTIMHCFMVAQLFSS